MLSSQVTRADATKKNLMLIMQLEPCQINQKHTEIQRLRPWKQQTCRLNPRDISWNIKRMISQNRDPKKVAKSTESS